MLAPTTEETTITSQD